MKKSFLIIVLLLLIVGGFLGYKYYNYISQPNVSVSKTDQLFIKEDSDFEDVLAQLKSNEQLLDEASFVWVADKMKYNKVKPGQYILNEGQSNRALVSMLRGGQQKAVKLTFNNARKIENLAATFGKILEPDSISFLNYFLKDSLLEANQLTPENIMTIFIPNTYQVYWNTGPAKIFEKLKRENKKFWNEKRMKLLNELEMTQQEAYILASIVQKESNARSEKPTIAGLYINRLKRGQLLQADPTVVFAVNDFTIRRVLNKHIAFESPFNTYLHEGLPPGPICMPDVSSIDAVLNYEKHKYLYMCASPDNSGKHAFAKTLVQHNANADKYRQWLNSRKIYR